MVVERAKAGLDAATETDPDRALRDWLCAHARKHPRWGYRRAYHAARVEGWTVNHKKTQRLWRDEGLRVPQRWRRNRVGILTVQAPAATGSNIVWAVDLQFDADEAGRPIKICSIVDEHTRECLGGPVERSIAAERIIGQLDTLTAQRGRPYVLRSDNGPEFISSAMDDWAQERTGLAYIPPGSPWRIGYVESFNARLRDKYLNINSFYSLTHARVIISDWKTEYNHHRRHSALGCQTPAECAQQCTHQEEPDDHTTSGPNNGGESSAHGGSSSPRHNQTRLPARDLGQQDKFRRERIKEAWLEQWCFGVAQSSS